MKTYRDHYFLKAKRENYPARSVYKLKEIHKRFGLFRPGMKVLDLGAAPGSWSLGATEYLGPSGSVLAVDIQNTATEFPPQVTFIQSDVFEPNPALLAALEARKPFDLVISDMAPSTIGHRATDQARSAALCGEALALARKYLIKGGGFVVKVFMGPDVEVLVKEMRPHFDKVKSFKPQSSRSESFETFFVALGFRDLPRPDPGGC